LTGHPVTTNDYKYIQGADVKSADGKTATPAINKTAGPSDGNFNPTVVDPTYGVKTTLVTQPDKDGKPQAVSGYNDNTYKVMKTSIDQGHPVIVGGSTSDNSGTHYVVVSGYNAPGNKPADFTIKDPANASRTTLADYQKKYTNLNEVRTVTGPR
jgi:hypothetical protein